MFVLRGRLERVPGGRSLRSKLLFTTVNVGADHDQISCFEKERAVLIIFSDAQGLERFSSAIFVGVRWQSVRFFPGTETKIKSVNRQGVLVASAASGSGNIRVRSAKFEARKSRYRPSHFPIILFCQSP